MIYGVDYASVDGNPPPDFAAAYRWGARFAVIRAVYSVGATVEVDPTWARDHAAARAAGLQVAPYLILGWSAVPAAQVARLIEAYGDAGDGDLPVALDVEGAKLAPAQALAQVEAAVVALTARYRAVMIYTSHVVWTEQLGDLPSPVCGACPLWLKVGYPWKVHNPPKLADVPHVDQAALPRPWREPGSPGAFLEQFQGDAIQVGGFAYKEGVSGTVDLNAFLPYVAASADSRTAWVSRALAAAGFPTGATPASLASAIRAFQAARALTVDGDLEPSTWAALCAA